MGRLYFKFYVLNKDLKLFVGKQEIGYSILA